MSYNKSIDLRTVICSLICFIMKFAVGVFLLGALVLASDPGRQDEVGQRSSSGSQDGGNRLNISSRKQSDSSSSGSSSSSSILDGLGDALKNIFSGSTSTSSSSSSSPRQTDAPSSSRSRDDSSSSNSGSSSRSRSASSRSSDSRSTGSNGRIHGISRDNDALVDDRSTKALTSLKSSVQAAGPLHLHAVTSSDLHLACPQTLLAIPFSVLTLFL